MCCFEVSFGLVIDRFEFIEGSSWVMIAEGKHVIMMGMGCNQSRQWIYLSFNLFQILRRLNWYPLNTYDKIFNVGLILQFTWRCQKTIFVALQHLSSHCQALYQLLGRAPWQLLIACHFQAFQDGRQHGSVGLRHHHRHHGFHQQLLHLLLPVIISYDFHFVMHDAVRLYTYQAIRDQPSYSHAVPFLRPSSRL